MAVGRNARAMSYDMGASSPDEVAQHVERIDRALESLLADRHQLAVLREEVAILRAAAAEPPKAETRSAFERLVAKLQMTGVAVKEVTALVTPLKALAGLLGVSATLLGL